MSSTAGVALLVRPPELHFTRAAARLFIAKQALSREMLESGRLGRRSSPGRRVACAEPAGERILVRARELLALHDATGGTSPAARTYVAELMSEGRRTGLSVLEERAMRATSTRGCMARDGQTLSAAGRRDRPGFGRAGGTWRRRESAALSRDIPGSSRCSSAAR